MRPSQEESAEGLLMACHARMRRTVEGVRALATLEDRADPRALPTAVAAARYLRDGLPLHGRDEDHSLAPRLRALGADAALEEALATMTLEHGELEGGLPGLISLLDAWPQGSKAELAERQLWLEGLLGRHMELEERLIFPRIGELSQAAQAEIVGEIRERRRT